ncbi:vWA domain-containing protein [Iningainema tapete]|uniref:VWA domain-containing protein n=1 Tax=Iningainema tapete BLCC-T55 TaxID=2748662 RepID=A0A8J7BZQ2_9CYAN|nr:vWA domain-containing protein [Iningainema tapete]MBD2776403.1 VWA domain-containing protein [Iningainema tapete BLCC-T55]
MTTATNTPGVRYAVDLVMCIDGTGSMFPIIEEVKASALSFYDKLEAKMAEKNKRIDQLRAKVIVFRDYWADPAEKVMVCSNFLNLRTQASDFAAFISEIVAEGGGDEPENGLEALGLALTSNWEKAQDFAKQRYVILMWTDASAHSLDKGLKPSHYPQEIPQTFDELTDYWSEIPKSAKRLILYAPDTNPWSVIGCSWDNAIHFPSKGGSGLEEFEFSEILDAIASSV